MKVLARESGVRLPNILAKDVQEWLRRGITLEDADYAFKAAARAGSVRFSFVEAVFDRLLLQRGPVRASQHTYREDMEPLSFENHRRRTQG